jgi:hypothetical protein
MNRKNVALQAVVSCCILTLGIGCTSGEGDATGDGDAGGDASMGVGAGFTTSSDATSGGPAGSGGAATAGSGGSTTGSTGGSGSTSSGTGGGNMGPAGPRVSTFTDSAPIVASSNQIIEGVRIQSGGECITIPQGVTGVIVRDSDIGPCGGSANVLVFGADITIEFNRIHDGSRGVLANSASNVTTSKNLFDSFVVGGGGKGSAIEYDYMDNAGVVDGNVVTGSNYPSDAVSFFQTSNARLTNNIIDISVAEPSAAAFTMGDAGPQSNPGQNNYVAGNIVHQTGGVPAGVFGSSGNTVLERNCLTHGIQAYNYNNNAFDGVTIQYNVINLGASFVPDSSVISNWSTNIDSTDCSLIPQ